MTGHQQRWGIIFSGAAKRKTRFSACLSFVLSAHFRYRRKSGPRTVGRRFCAVRVFWPQAKTSAQAEFTSAEHFKNLQVSKKKHQPTGWCFFLEAPPRIELGNKAFAELCLTAWLWRHMEDGKPSHPHLFGAGDEARTRYLHLGKVALYQMSYTCIRSTHLGPR